jgi:quercetin dioxygenase-like cupin family protein
MTRSFSSNRIILSLTVTFSAAIIAALAVIALNAQASDTGSSNPVTAEFPDDVRAQFNVQLGDTDSGERGMRQTQVAHVHDLSELTIEEFAFGPGEGSSWHTHPSPVIIVVTHGELTVTYAGDCEPRTYQAGEAFVDTGLEVHEAFNQQDDANTELQAVWLGEPGTDFLDPDEFPEC